MSKGKGTGASEREYMLNLKMYVNLFVFAKYRKMKSPSFPRLIRRVSSARSLGFHLGIIFFSMIGSSSYSAPMSFEVYIGTPSCIGCILIRADGEITNSTASEFESFILNKDETLNKDTTLVLNSPGGSLAGGLEMGSLLRARGISTHIARIESPPNDAFSLAEGVCASSCAYAFLGGQRRSIEQRSRYGVHQVSTYSDDSIPLSQAVKTTQDVISQVIQYVEDMGASTEIVTLATRTSDESIRWLEEGELSSFGIVNSAGLAQQRPWEKVYQSMSWAVTSLLSDGSRDRLIMNCDEFPSSTNTAGHVRVIFRQQKKLPTGHPLSGSFSELPTQVYFKGRVVHEEQEQLYLFDHEGHATYGLQIPASTISSAVSEGEAISIRVKYPEDFPEHFTTQSHPLPLDGIAIALADLSENCPHLGL
jgi:hypothetical protein